MATATERVLEARYLGRISYRDALVLQEEARRRLLGGRDRGQATVPETLLLLEHDPVYTLGRNASEDDVVADGRWLEQMGIEVVESDRGGQVTYHGPGQLVAYPILDLTPDRRDVRRYVRDLGQAILDLLSDYGLTGQLGSSERIGVWVEGQKIASIGVHLKRWVTTHGLAVNVSTDLSSFSGIVPCGLHQVSMTSIEQLTGRQPPLADAAKRCARHLARTFGRRLEWPLGEPAAGRPSAETTRPKDDPPLAGSGYV